MKYLIFTIVFFSFVQLKAQSEYGTNRLIQDKKGDEVETIAEKIRANIISASDFLQTLEDNPLTLKKYINTMAEKNDLTVLVGTIDNIEIVGENNSVCKIQFKNNFWYEMSIYLPIQEDFYELEKGDVFYAFVNIGDISKYEIKCNVALGAQSVEGLATKFVRLIKALQENDFSTLRYLLDVNMYYPKISFENNLNSFRKLLD